jgi:hypothetical protein
MPPLPNLASEPRSTGVFRHFRAENGIGYPHPNPPVPAGMGRVRVQLKLNGWVRMGAHIYYTMASRAPGGLMASAKLGLGLKTPETIHNQ